MTPYFDYLLKKIRHYLTGVVSLYPTNGSSKGTILLSYITDPFLIHPDRKLSTYHSNYWECAEIARLFLERGYTVDAIDGSNDTFLPKKPYLACIDIHKNIERLAAVLPKKCKKVFHITGEHWLSLNSAECQRLLALKERRGVALVPRRAVTPHKNLEYADLGTIIGNNRTQTSYAYAGKPLYEIPISSPQTFPFVEEKDFDQARKKFLWFAGSGAVHKGLDLLLEAFVDLPNYTLTICGPIANERDFIEAYRAELFETPNIHFLGRITIEGSEFREIAATHAAIIFPSCSEGCPGSVINCMQAGLIPIVTHEASVEIGNFGALLQEASVKEMKKQIQIFAEQPATEIKERAHRTWEWARTHHTREHFSQTFSHMIDTVIL